MTDRMGYRLQGPALHLLNNTQEMISEASCLWYDSSYKGWESDYSNGR